jgi:hypothetical protein
MLCLLCQHGASSEKKERSDDLYVNCPVCGRYEMTVEAGLVLQGGSISAEDRTRITWETPR